MIKQRTLTSMLKSGMSRLSLNNGKTIPITITNGKIDEEACKEDLYQGNLKLYRDYPWVYPRPVKPV